MLGASEQTEKEVKEVKWSVKSTITTFKTLIPLKRKRVVAISNSNYYR